MYGLSKRYKFNVEEKQKMIDEVKLNEYYNAIIDKLKEMIPVKWTRILLYAEETGERSYADFYFYTEDGELHEFVKIHADYNQSDRIMHDHMDTLMEINKALWLEFKKTGETQWCTYSMDISSDCKFTIKYNYEFINEPAVGFRVVRWAYDEYGIIPKNHVDKEKLRNLLAEQGRPVPEELYSREKVYYIKPDGGELYRDKIKIYKKYIDRYNKIFERENIQEQDFESAVDDIILTAGENNTKIFLQAMILLLLAYQNRNPYRSVWTESAHVSLEWGDKEVCRELVLYAIKQSSKSDVKNSSDEFIALSKENKDDHVVDIIGMVIEELNVAGDLNEQQYNEILTDFAEPVQLWRHLEVPKVCQKNSYNLIYQIIELCCEHEAYISALRLSGLLYIADTTKKWERLAGTMLLTGKIVYELGFMEVAKRCFIFADKDTNGECWNSVEDKYKAVLYQETKLEITDEIRKMQQEIDEIFARKDSVLYSEDDISDIIDGKIKIPPYGITGSNYFYIESKIAKARKRLSDKAAKKYEEYAQGTPEERSKGIEKAFALFKESSEVYESAGYLYFLKANLYMDDKDYESAYEYFLKAYNCKDGKCNGLVLLGIAIALSQLGRMTESTAYLFRAYILCGKNFIIEKVGEQAWKRIEKYEMKSF